MASAWCRREIENDSSVQAGEGHWLEGRLPPHPQALVAPERVHVDNLLHLAVKGLHLLLVCMLLLLLLLSIAAGARQLERRVQYTFEGQHCILHLQLRQVVLVLVQQPHFQLPP